MGLLRGRASGPASRPEAHSSSRSFSVGGLEGLAIGEQRMEQTISGLTVFAVCYGIFYVLTPIWRRGWLPAWARIPRGILAWTMFASLVGPSWGFGEVLVELFTQPNAGTGFTFGFYAILFSLIAWIASYPDAINFFQVWPLVQVSARFRKERWTKVDVFAGAEQKEIESIYREQTGRSLSFDPLRAVREHQTVAKARLELETVRKERQEQAGAEDVETLRSGQPADITDVLRLFTMHRSPHRLITATFRVMVLPDVRICHLHTLFPGLRRTAVSTADARFRFHQDVVDLLQVFTGQPWLDRFRPFFSTLLLSGYVEVRDSFDLPQREELFRLTIDVAHLDARKGAIFIATELERLGTFEWMPGPAA
jgi:hypothetical protein